MSDSIKAIVQKAAEIDSDTERAEYLARACGDDAQLRLLIESFLSEGREEASESKTRTAENRTSDYVNDAFDGTSAKTLGPYRLMEKIAEGGMGVVYVAEQSEPVRRRVALKVIKPGTDTQEVIARFNAERQALAMMDHPNIARVYDAGTTPEGRPYFVMELVRGIPVTKFCDQHKLSSAERLELFIDLCHAIQHAHQKGIIHRDIKPNNVLVASHDGKPVVKVIDFGVAKAIHQRLTEHTIYTRFSQVVGTPLYMSPEQAEMSGLDIDTRTDIYSLGVLLYELLTGETPFDRARMMQAAYDEMRRILREEEPPRPSTRISTLGESAGSISQSRRTNPKSLSLSLRGDLDWIVMKAIEKDRTRRYETANGFALDVRRYLEDEPVLASPPSTTYRLRKLIHRNRGVFTAITLIGVVLVLGIAGTTYGMWSSMQANARIVEQNRDLDESNQSLADANRSIQQKHRELTEANQREVAARDRAERVREFLIESYRTSDPTREGRRMTAVDLLARSVEQIELALADDQPMQADLFSAIGRSYNGLGMYAESLDVFNREKQLRIATAPVNDRLRLRAERNYAYALYHNGKLDHARELLEEIVRRQQTSLATDDLDTLYSQDCLAHCYLALNRSTEAMNLYEEIAARRRDLQGEDHPDTLSAYASLVVANQRLGKLDVALKLALDNLARHRAVLGDDHPATFGALGRLASIQTALGQFDDAITLYREAWERRQGALGTDHPLTLRTQSGLGLVLRDAGRLEEALKTLEDVLHIQQRALGSDHHSTLSSANNLARVFLDLGRYREAIPLVEDCFEKHRILLGKRSQETLDSMNTLGMTYFYAGQTGQAVPVFEELLEIYQELLGEDNPTTVTLTNNLAMTYQHSGELDNALPLLEKAFHWRREHLGNDHPKTLVSQQNLASVYRGLGRLTEAIEMSEETVELHQRKLGKGHRQTIAAACALANSYADRGDSLEALQLSRETLEAARQALGDDHPGTLRAANSVAIAAAGCGFWEEANRMYAETLEGRLKTLGESHSFTIQSKSNLAAGMISTGDAEQAVRLALEATAAAEESLDEDHSVSISAKCVLGRAYLLNEEPELAIAILKSAAEQRERTVGTEHPNYWKARHYLAQAYHDNDQSMEASDILTSILEKRVEHLGGSHPAVLASRSLLAKCLIAQNQFEQAEAELRTVWEQLGEVGADEPLLPARKTRLVRAANDFILLYEAWSDPEKVAHWTEQRDREQDRAELP